MTRSARLVLLLVVAVAAAFGGSVAPTGEGTLSVRPVPVADAQAGCDWTGTWDTWWWDENEELGTAAMVLLQEGDVVTGRYSFELGVIGGSLVGNVLTGSWLDAPSFRPPDDAGDLEFTIAADCLSFAGVWRYGSEGVWYVWYGTRQ